MSTLDLTGADTKGFDAIPSGTYACTVFEAQMQETKGGPEAKLPAGTPKINVQFRISEGEHENRRLFNAYVIPPADYVNAAKLKGMLVNFLKAVGYDEKKIVSGKFNLDVEDLIGREVNVVVGQKPKYNGAEGEMDNEVRGVKAPGAVNSGGGLL